MYAGSTDSILLYAAGSPSSSTSCHHAQLHFDRVLNAAQASSGITNNYEQAERPLPVRKRHSRKPARAEPMLPAATFHEAAALEEPKEDLAAQPPSEDRRSRHKPKKMWEVSHSLVVCSFVFLQ